MSYILIIILKFVISFFLMNIFKIFFMSLVFSSLPMTWLSMGLILFTLMGIVWVSWICYFFYESKKKISHNYFNHLSISCTLKFHAGTSSLEIAPWSMNSLCLILNSGQPLYCGCFLWNGFPNLFSLTQIVNIYRVPHTCRKPPLIAFNLLDCYED